MDAPQSRAEVDPVEQSLRLLDDALRIEWEPRAVMVKRGGYDARGKVINPVYDGRWKVVKKHDPFRTAMWREDSLVCYLTAPMVTGSGEAKVHALTADGPYAPVGEWVVELFRSWDRANRAFVDARLKERLDEENARMDAAAVEGTGGEAEYLEEMFFNGTMRGGVSTSHPVGVTLTKE
jgi:hypothetical protein